MLDKEYRQVLVGWVVEMRQSFINKLAACSNMLLCSTIGLGIINLFPLSDSSIITGRYGLPHNGREKRWCIEERDSL